MAAGPRTDRPPRCCRSLRHSEQDGLALGLGGHRLGQRLDERLLLVGLGATFEVDRRESALKATPAATRRGDRAGSSTAGTGASDQGDVQEDGDGEPDAKHLGRDVQRPRTKEAKTLIMMSPALVITLAVDPTPSTTARLGCRCLLYCSRTLLVKKTS